MTKEGAYDSLFLFVEAVVLAASAGVIGPLAGCVNNCNDGAEVNGAPNLLLGCALNLSLEDMVDLRYHGIAIGDNNYPAPYNVPRQGETTSGTIK